MTRVAFVISKLGKGGAEQVVWQLSQFLEQESIENLCCCFEELGSLGERLVQCGESLAVIGSKRSFDVVALYKLYRVLRKFTPDVISVHSLSVLPYVVMANGLIGAKIVFTAHGLLFTGFRRKRPVYRLFGKHIDEYTAVSERAASVHRRYMGWKRNIHIIENGSRVIETSLENRLRIRCKFDVKDDEFLFVAVGNIKKEKGIEVICNAVDILGGSSGKRRLKVLIVGDVWDKEYYGEISRLIGNSGIGDRIIFAGYQQEIAPFYSGADGYLISSHSEGLPMALLEAMSCGLPVIATSVGGIPNVLKDGAGILIKRNAPKELADAMNTLMCMTVGERHALGSRGRRRMLDGYSIRRMAGEYATIFRCCGI